MTDLPPTEPPASAARETRRPSLVVGILLFVLVYVALLGLAVSVIPAKSMQANQVAGFAAAIVASLACVFIYERGRWDLGIVRPFSVVGRDLVLGVAIATVTIALSDLLIIATTGFRHTAGAGLPWSQLLWLFIPAAVHEELLFRGYVFQRLIDRFPRSGVLVLSSLFALLHLGNPSIAAVSVLNIFLAGVLLSLAYLLYRTLWLPIVLHTWWNILSGPVLGHEVSGFVIKPTLFGTVDPGPTLLTGGTFGIEGSLWTSIVELAMIAFLWFRIRRSRSIVVI